MLCALVQPHLGGWFWGLMVLFRSSHGISVGFKSNLKLAHTKMEFYSIHEPFRNELLGSVLFIAMFRSLSHQGCPCTRNWVLGFLARAPRHASVIIDLVSSPDKWEGCVRRIQADQPAVVTLQEQPQLLFVLQDFWSISSFSLPTGTNSIHNTNTSTLDSS